MIIRRNIELAVIFFAWLGSGCALIDDSAPKKLSPTGLIATPATYYSTAKARYLGTKYKENLDRLAERIVRNPNTAQLQFANNISSVGGIGFFTHSATESPDERYLEVVLAAPETFETKGEYSEKVHQLFSRYGPALLGIIAGDSEIFADQQLSGYGLNFTWRTVTSEAAANRVSLARAIIYFHKEKVANFLRQGLNQNELLRDAVIFAVEDNGPLELVSYQPRETKPDFRPAIREDNLPPALAKPTQLPPSSPARREATKAEPVKQQAPIAQQTPARAAANVPMPPVEKGETQTPAAAQGDVPLVSRSAESAGEAGENSLPPKRDGAAGKLALGNRAQSAPMNLPPSTAKPEPTADSTKTMPSPASDLTPPAGENKLPEESTVSDSATVVAPVPQPRASEKVTSDKTAEILREETASTAINQRKAREPEAKVAKETPKPLPAVATSKGSGEAAKPKPMAEIIAPETIAAPPPPVKAPAPRVAEEKVVAAPAPAAAKPEDRQPKIETVPVPVTPAPRQTGKTTIASEPHALPTPEVKAKDSVRPQEKTPPVPAPAKVAKPLETKPAAPLARAATEEKQSETKEIARAPRRAPVTLPPLPKSAPEPVAKAALPAVAAESAKTPEVKVASVPVARPTTRPSPEAPPAQENAMTSPSISVAKSESPVVAKPALPPPVTAVQEKAGEKPAAEQLASLRKPEPATVAKKPLARPVPRPLEGFIIQIAFSDKEKAQNWAEKMERRGYAVSVTEAGASGALRVRLGNFTMRDDAERQLRSFKQEGMNGIVVNLPQAFRPEARSSVP